MRILHTVQNYFPSKGGMQEVVKQLSERLAQKGHEVTVATSYHPDRDFEILNGVTIKSFQIKGNIVEGITGDPNAYIDYVLNSDFDVVANFAAQQWATDALLPRLKEIQARKIFIPTGFSALHQPSYKSYFDQMANWLKDYDANVFLSNNYRDINFARLNGVSNYVVIPNGAGMDEFGQTAPVNIREKINVDSAAKLILHVGSYTKVKGQMEAIKIFLRSGIRNCVLLFIGDGIFELDKEMKFHPIFQFFKIINLLRNNKIVFSEFNRQETVAAYQQADIFLFPSNIECSPIVLFESMASKTPFLTADVGNSAEIIEWSGAGLLMPTKKDEFGYSHVEIQKSAKMLYDLVTNDNLRTNLGHNGHQCWRKKFTWEVITDAYEKLYSNSNDLS